VDVDEPTGIADPGGQESALTDGEGVTRRDAGKEPGRVLDRIPPAIDYRRNDVDLPSLSEDPPGKSLRAGPHPHLVEGEGQPEGARGGDLGRGGIERMEERAVVLIAQRGPAQESGEQVGAGKGCEPLLVRHMNWHCFPSRRRLAPDMTARYDSEPGSRKMPSGCR